MAQGAGDEMASVAQVAPGGDQDLPEEEVAEAIDAGLITAVPLSSALMLVISSMTLILPRLSEFLVRGYLPSLNRCPTLVRAGRWSPIGRFICKARSISRRGHRLSARRSNAGPLSDSSPACLRKRFPHM